MVFTMNALHFQRTHPVRGMGDYSLNTSKGIDMGVVGVAPTCGSEPVVDGVRTAAEGSARETMVFL